MRLFDLIPDRFFSVLASPAREFYADALFLIFDLYRQNTFGLPREAVVDTLAAYLELEGAELLDADLAEDGAGGGPKPGRDDGPTPNPTPVSSLTSSPTSGRTPRERAAAVLRKLVATGWIEIETRTNYAEYVNLIDYARRILEALDRIRTQRAVEYQAFVYSTYHTLNGLEDPERDGGLAVEQAYELTYALINEVKSLHHNIKRYTEKLLKQKRPQDILAAHFLDYQSQVLDRSYYYLKTSDNVSKYRPRILRLIDQWLLLEPDWVRRVARAEVGRGKYPTQEQAETEVLSRLRFIQESYGQMDDLLEEIDRRNAQYAKASLDQVRYLLSSNKNTEGQLIDLLKFMAERIKSSEWVRDEPLPPEWQGLYALGEQQNLDEGSLFTPRQARSAHQPSALSLPEPDLVARREAARQAADKLRRALTYDRVSDYVLERLGERRSMRASDLNVETTDDFVKLIYIAAYGRSRRVRYRVSFEGEEVQSQGDRFRFRDIRIERK